MGKKNLYGLESFLSKPSGVNVQEQAATNEDSMSQTGKGKRGRPSKPSEELKSASECRVTFVAEKATMAKIRLIAEKEQLPLKNIIDTALTEIIKRYEQKNGSIDVDASISQRSFLDLI